MCNADSARMFFLFVQFDNSKMDQHAKTTVLVEW